MYKCVFLMKTWSLTNNVLAILSVASPTLTKTNMDANIGFLPQYVNYNPNNEGNNKSQSAVLRLFSELRQRLRPWSEFFKFSKFGCPQSLVGIPLRVKTNIQYFITNYTCLFAILFVYCILTSFLMLLAFIVLAGLFYAIYQTTSKGPVVIGGHEVPPSLMYSLALMLCFPLFVFANVGEIVYWVVGSGLFLIVAHSVFYSSEESPADAFDAEIINA